MCNDAHLPILREPRVRTLLRFRDLSEPTRGHHADDAAAENHHQVKITKEGRGQSSVTTMSIPVPSKDR